MMSPEKFLDKTAEKIVDTLSKSLPGRRIRNSQILTALVGFVGFVMFLDGMQKLFYNFPTLNLIIIGFALMALSGVLLQKLSK